MTLSVRESLSIKISNVSNISKRLQKQPCIPFRYLIIFFAFLVSAISFAVRNVVNFAILAMVNEEDPSASLKSNTTMVQNEIKFNWDQRDQGFVLGAYFYTYTSAQIISGILTDKFNAVHLLTASQLIAAICSFLSPILAEYGIYYFIAIRMVLGLAHGVLFPSCFILVERWLSPGEVALAQSCIQVGSNFGIVVIMPLTAYLCESGFIGGWPSAYYTVAAINIIFIVFWVIAITLDPSTNRWVSTAEKEMISRVNNSKTVKTKINKTPWKALLTSLPLWSVMVARGINGLTYYAINAKIPVYLETVLGYKLKGNGVINSLLYVAICSTQLITGPASRYVIDKKWLSKTNTRKVFETIALVGSGLCIAIIPNFGDRSDFIVIILILSMFFLGFTVGGDTPIVPEMAPHLLGTTYGFANTFSCASGFIAPALIAAILGDQVHSKDLWNATFYTLAGLQAVGCLAFLRFATADHQPWGTIKNSGDSATTGQQAKSRSNEEKAYDISSRV